MTNYVLTNFTDLLGAQQLAEIKGGNRELVPDWYPTTTAAKTEPDLFRLPATIT
jgi:hypothetical protein